jgi:hypothetical protein
MIPQGISWNGSVWVAVGRNASGLGDSNIQYSVNGIDWNSTSPSITNEAFYSVASRRPLPFVGETAVPPVFNQGTGPGGALMYTSPTGTNNMYYSRFLSLTENAGTGTLDVNGSIQIGPTGFISTDQSGNLNLGDVSGNGVQIIHDFNAGPMIRPVKSNKQILFQASSSGSDYVFLNSVSMGPQASTLSLGQPGYVWNGLNVSPTGINFSSGPTITADSSNVIVSSNLIPDVSNTHSLGSVTQPWKDIWVGTGSVHIGPTGTITADQQGNVIISTNSGLSLTGPLGPSQVYDSVYNPPPGGGGGASGEFLTENFMVAVGSSSGPNIKTIVYSYDSINWNNTIISGTNTSPVRSVAWNGSYWLAGAEDGVISYSSNGIN